MAPHLFIKFLSKAIYCPKFKTFYICNLLSLWALSNCCDPFERCISYSHDQDHVHSTYFANFYTRSCARLFHPFHSKKYKLHLIHGYSLQVERIWASKKILDTWRSNAFKIERKEIWTHEGPMCFKKKVSPCTKENKREVAHERSSYIIYKFHTHLHILIKVYDLFLLKDPVFDLATQEG